jgi:hypothetical protein
MHVHTQLTWWMLNAKRFTWEHSHCGNDVLSLPVCKHCLHSITHSVAPLIRPVSVYTTMKVYSISIILAPPSGPSTMLCQGTDLSQFSFYQKGSVGEFMNFMSKTVAERTPQGQRQSVQENNYTAHVYNRGGAEQLAGTFRDGMQRDRSTLMHNRCHHNGYGVSRPPCILSAGESHGRFHGQGATIVIQQPELDLVPRDQRIRTEVPRSPSGGLDHASSAGAR